MGAEIVFESGVRLVTADDLDVAALAERLNGIQQDPRPLEWFLRVRLQDGREAWVNPDRVLYVTQQQP